MDEPRDHILNKRHVPAAFTGSPLRMTKIVLHVDNDQHAMLWFDPFLKTKSHASSSYW
jgi:hypothetical protein